MPEHGQEGTSKKTGTEMQKNVIKIMDLIKERGKYRIGHKELYQKLETTTTAMGKYITSFYFYPARINNRKSISIFFNTISSGKAIDTKWTKLIRKYIEQLDIDRNLI